LVESLFDDSLIEDRSWKKLWHQPIDQRGQQCGEKDICSLFHRIEWTIVNIHPQTTIFLLHKMGGTSSRRRAWANVPFIKQFSQLIFNSASSLGGIQ
jgi:hypothetical protein